LVGLATSNGTMQKWAKDKENDERETIEKNRTQTKQENYSTWEKQCVEETRADSERRYQAVWQSGLG
jgi:hypothetical protein